MATIGLLFGWYLVAAAAHLVQRRPVVDVALAAVSFGAFAVVSGSFAMAGESGFMVLSVAGITGYSMVWTFIALPRVARLFFRE